MSGYAQLLERMMGAIESGDTAAARDVLRAKPDFPAEAQLAVYTQGYRQRLIEAIESTYPALAYYLGARPFTFRALAEGFITAQPSRHFNLDKYTIAFGPYAARESGDAFAADLALLESAIHEVYQGEETPAMAADWMRGQAPETLGEAVLLPRAASRLLAFGSPVDDYFTAFRDGEKPIKPPEGKRWLIVLRHRHQVKRLPLEEAEYTLLCLLAERLTLEQALDDSRMEAHTEQADFPARLTSWFARWPNEGILRQPV